MNFNSRSAATALLVVVVVLLAYMLLTKPDNRDLGTRLDDAAQELQDRTPAEKIKDSINEATEPNKP